jgi:hypothetical protein
MKVLQETLVVVGINSTGIRVIIIERIIHRKYFRERVTDVCE